MIKDAITTVEAGEILGRDSSTIRHMIRKGQIAFEKRGRDNYVSLATVKAILKSRAAKKNGNKRSK